MWQRTFVANNRLINNYLITIVFNLILLINYNISIRLFSNLNYPSKMQLTKKYNILLIPIFGTL